MSTVHISDFFKKKSVFFKKSSKPGRHGNLVLITSSSRTLKLKLNLDDKRTNVTIFLDSCAMMTIVCTLLSFLPGGIELPTKFSKRVALTGPWLLEGVEGKKGRGGYKFYMKNKLKSEIFNDIKKFTNKNVFLCHN